jgi:hypothetical protein
MNLSEDTAQTAIKSTENVITNGLRYNPLSFLTFVLSLLLALTIIIQAVSNYFEMKENNVYLDKLHNDNLDMIKNLNEITKKLDEITKNQEKEFNFYFYKSKK